MKLKFDNITYDFLKKVALIYAPCIITLWLTLVDIWHIPFGIEIGATMSAINLCLGGCLGVSSSNYYKGDDTQNDE